MKKLLMTSLMAAAMIILMCSNVQAQTTVSPTVFQKDVGFGYDAGLNMQFPIAYYGNGGPLGATNIGFSTNMSMPPILEANESSVMFVYTKDELGRNGSAGKLSGIRIPILLDNNGAVYEAGGLFWLNIGETGYFAEYAPQIRVDIKNVPAANASDFTRDVNIEKADVLASANGWENVWNDEWNYTTNEITFEYASNGYEYAFLVITFDEPFEYSGEDVWIAISNVDGNYTAGNPTPSPYIYTFLSFFKSFDAANPADRYLGPKWSTPMLIYDWSFSTSTNSPLDISTETDYYAIDFYYKDLSYRPAMKFDYPMMGVTEIAVNDGYKLTDNRFVISNVNIKTKNIDFPIKLTELAFTTQGTTEGLTISKAILYKSATGLIGDTVKLTELVPSMSGDNFFEIASNELIGDDATVKDNHFYIIYEIASTGQCGDVLGININNLVIDRDNRELVGEDAPTSVTVNAQKTYALEFDRVLIINNDEKNITLCFEEGEPHTFNVGTICGKYTTIQWQKFNNQTSLWENIEGATETSYTIEKDIDYTRYKATVVPQEGFGAPILNEIEWTINYEHINKIEIVYTGDFTEYDLLNLMPYSELTFDSKLEAGSDKTPLNYVWQIRIGDGMWSDIEGFAGPNATSCITNTSLPGTYYIRVELEPAETAICRSTVYSNELSFTVLKTDLSFEFINHPASKKVVCKNTPLEIFVSFFGKIDETNSYWLKDGLPYLDASGKTVSDRFLRINSVNALTSGAYTYKATALVSKEGAPGEYETLEFVSNPCEIYIVPDLEIFQAPQQYNYIMPGEQVAFEVVTTYTKSGDELVEGEGFQWYKYIPGVGNIKIEDDHIFKGAKSNVLVITNANDLNDDAVYTFNGAYYFLEITNQCGVITTSAAEQRTYLFPGDNMGINNISNAVICAVGEKVEFEAVVDYENMSDVAYQWYFDGKKLTDNARISGSQTNILSIEPTEAADLNKKIYCQASLISNSNAFVKTNEVMIVKPYLQIEAKTPPADTVYLDGTSNQHFEFAIKLQTDNSTLNYHKIVKKDDTVFAETYNSSELFIPTYITGISAPKTLEIIITDDCGNTVSAKWNIERTENEGIVSGINDEIYVTNNSISINPNPVNDVLTVSYNSISETPTNLELCGLTGNTIATIFDGLAQVGTNKINFNLAKLHLPSGTYFIRISNKFGTQSKQFLFVK